MFKFLLLQLAFSYSLTEYTTTYAPTGPTPGPTGSTYSPTGTTYRPTGSTYHPTTSPDPYGCPVGWVQSTEGCFLFHHTGTYVLIIQKRIKDRIFSAIGLTWRQGQEECEKLGGYLAEIKSQEQQDFLVSFN